MKLKYRLLLVTFIGLLVLDQGSKLCVERYVPLHYSREVIKGILNITHIQNPGAAFGLMADHRQSFYLFTAITLAAIGVLIYYFRRVSERDRLISVALSLIITGAVGNLIDRLRLGAVVDFLDFHYKYWHWPAFNVADAAITIGLSLLAIKLLWGGRKKSQEEA